MELNMTKMAYKRRAARTCGAHGAHGAAGRRGGAAGLLCGSPERAHDAPAADKARAQGGFTLVELIVVLAVMALLLSAFIPPLMGYRQETAERERLANADAIGKAIRQCYALEGRYPPATGETGLDYLRDNYGVIVKPETYRYSYAIVDGAPQLAVERLDGE
ncbi:MAG: type II secretion system GspH family protein [Clostridiales bacterium]|jgi:prepilin-type N-terminal cleavage/methylation domain-containing protein|nr:type II secretion system GspH family protein [Clostridiales bacterium]